jgi:GNAT superfamily N-acetyltransferase
MASEPTPAGVTIRLLEPTDSIVELTALLHRAYGPLARRGFRFWASHQDEEATRMRIAEGRCFVAVAGQQVVATITLKTRAHTKGSPWYDRPGVASFGQFAVEPDLQSRGIGSALLETVERRAPDEGVGELALDTAEGATALIRMYTKRGYRFIEHVDWRPDTNYRSVILSKSL